MVLDCPDPRALTSFYADLLNGRPDTSDRNWCEVYIDEPPLKLALDLTVSDLEAASLRAVSLGATVLTGPGEDPGGMFIVHADRAGHSFCLFMERSLP